MIRLIAAASVIVVGCPVLWAIIRSFGRDVIKQERQRNQHIRRAADAAERQHLGRPSSRRNRALDDLMAGFGQHVEQQLADIPADQISRAYTKEN